MADLRKNADVNQLAAQIVQKATGQEEPAKPKKNIFAQILGRLGGLKGGPARAAALAPEQRKQIAKKAAKKRWGKQ